MGPASHFRTRPRCVASQEGPSRTWEHEAVRHLGQHGGSYINNCIQRAIYICASKRSPNIHTLCSHLPRIKASLCILPLLQALITGNGRRKITRTYIPWCPCCQQYHLSYYNIAPWWQSFSIRESWSVKPVPSSCRKGVLIRGGSHISMQLLSAMHPSQPLRQ